MVKAVVIIIALLIGWNLYNNFDLNEFKKNSVESLKKEKTINAINSRRDREQADINKVIYNEY